MTINNNLWSVGNIFCMCASILQIVSCGRAQMPTKAAAAQLSQPLNICQNNYEPLIPYILSYLGEYNHLMLPLSKFCVLCPLSGHVAGSQRYHYLDNEEQQLICTSNSTKDLLYDTKPIIQCKVCVTGTLGPLQFLN